LTKLVECTRRLIDDELEFHHKIGSGEFVIDNDEYDHDNDEYEDKAFDSFFQERKKFFPRSEFFPGLADCQVGTLYVLPMCFYAPLRANQAIHARRKLRRQLNMRMKYGVQRRT
jgi:hypothetical protein